MAFRELMRGNQTSSSQGRLSRWMWRNEKQAAKTKSAGNRSVEFRHFLKRGSIMEGFP
jgi:hypothetical protein